MDKIESRENYLEAILQLTEDGKHPRSIDIAKKLGFSKPSISVAVKKLKEDGLIIVESDGEILLTKEGMEIAKRTLEKHEYLTTLLIKIGVDPILAEEQACKIEHDIDEDTFLKLKKYLEK